MRGMGELIRTARVYEERFPLRRFRITGRASIMDSRKPPEGRLKPTARYGSTIVGDTISFIVNIPLVDKAILSYDYVYLVRRPSKRLKASFLAHVSDEVERFG